MGTERPTSCRHCKSRAARWLRNGGFALTGSGSTPSHHAARQKIRRKIRFATARLDRGRQSGRCRTRARRSPRAALSGQRCFPTAPRCSSTSTRHPAPERRGARLGDARRQRHRSRRVHFAAAASPAGTRDPAADRCRRRPGADRRGAGRRRQRLSGQALRRPGAARAGRRAGRAGTSWSSAPRRPRTRVAAAAGARARSAARRRQRRPSRYANGEAAARARQGRPRAARPARSPRSCPSCRRPARRRGAHVAAAARHRHRRPGVLSDGCDRCPATIAPR